MLRSNIAIVWPGLYSYFRPTPTAPLLSLGTIPVRTPLWYFIVLFHILGTCALIPSGGVGISWFSPPFFLLILILILVVVLVVVLAFLLLLLFLFIINYGISGDWVPTNKPEIKYFCGTRATGQGPGPLSIDALWVKWYGYLSLWLHVGNQSRPTPSQLLLSFFTVDQSQVEQFVNAAITKNNETLRGSMKSILDS